MVIIFSQLGLSANTQYYFRLIGQKHDQNNATYNQSVGTTTNSGVLSNDNGALEKGIIMINILDAIHSLKPEYKTANISVTWNDNDTVADMDIDFQGGV